MSPYGASAWADLAVQLAWRLPGTGAALAAGTIDLARARLIAEAASPLSDEAARAVEARVLPAAGGQTTGMLRAALRRAVIAADPAGAEERRKDAERRAQVVLYPDQDGTATLAGQRLPGCACHRGDGPDQGDGPRAEGIRRRRQHRPAVRPGVYRPPPRHPPPHPAPRRHTPRPARRRTRRPAGPPAPGDPARRPAGRSRWPATAPGAALTIPAPAGRPRRLTSAGRRSPAADPAQRPGRGCAAARGPGRAPRRRSLPLPRRRPARPWRVQRHRPR